MSPAGRGRGHRQAAPSPFNANQCIGQQEDAFIPPRARVALAVAATGLAASATAATTTSSDSLRGIEIAATSTEGTFIGTPPGRSQASGARRSTTRHSAPADRNRRLVLHHERAQRSARPHGRIVHRRHSDHHRPRKRLHESAIRRSTARSATSESGAPAPAPAPARSAAYSRTTEQVSSAHASSTLPPSAGRSPSISDASGGRRWRALRQGRSADLARQLNSFPNAEELTDRGHRFGRQATASGT